MSLNSQLSFGVSSALITDGSIVNADISASAAIANSKIAGLAASATTDTTNAANISSGTLPAARMPALTGDITTTAGAVGTTLATVNSNVGAFGSATAIPVITVNAKGLVTAVSTSAVSIPSGSISVTGGDITLSGNTGTAITNATLATVNTNVGTFNNVTVNAKGLVTAASNISYLTALSDTLATVTARGASTATMLVLSGGGGVLGSDANGVYGLQVQGANSYASLEIGVRNNYEAVLRSYGNDIHYFAGHWRTTATASEDHSHYWYTAKNGSTNWNVYKMRLDHNGLLTATGGGTFNGITINQERTTNARIYSATTGSMGLLGANSDGTFRWQIYGDGTAYGFLESTWGNWDVQKTINGNMLLRVGGTNYTVYHSGNIPAYLTAEADTLATVTARGATTSTALTLSGNVTMSGSGLFLNRIASATHGLSWYSSGYTAWSTYMAAAAATSVGPTGNITAPSGTYVTSWALRNFVENISTYGWTWESGTGTGQPSVVAELRASDGLFQANGSVRSPIFYDSNDTAYYVDPAGGNARISRDLYVSGNTSGNLGNRVIVGNTTTSFTHEDANMRPVFHAHGQYPVLSLNHTVTSNTAHGPTVQFTANGTGNQFVIGMSGNGTRLDIGTSSNTNWNPHNGIDNLNGVTGFRMDTSGNVFNYISTRSPIFYDSDDTGYYVNPNGTSRFGSTIVGGHGGNAYDTASSGRLWFGTTADNAYSVYTAMENIGGNYTKLTLDWHTGIRIGAHPNYGGTRFYNNSIASSGTKIFSVGELDSNVRVYGDIRSPIYYDLDDTAYYCDPAGTSQLSGLSNGTKARAGLNIHHLNRQTNTTNTDYWVGSQGWHQTYNLDSCFVNLGSCFFDHWGATAHPRGNVHCQGIQALHYRSGTVAYGFQLVNGGDGSARMYTRAAWGNGGGSWYELAVWGLNTGGTLYPSISYDTDNTGYYVDANSTSRMGTINADSLYSYGNVTAYSDERLKKDWETLPTNFVEELAKIKSGTYTRIDSGERQVGVGAQSLQAILKEAVSEKEEYLGVHYGNAAMASAVELAKEVVNLKRLSAKQQKQVEDQSSEISELKSMIDILVDKINKLIN